MSKTGVLIEIDNSEVKDTTLGILTAAAGEEIYALVLDDDAAKVKDKLALYGAEHIISITAPGDVAASPDLQAQAIAAVVKSMV